MVIMISAQQDSMDSAVDQRFGRCQWLIKVDTETLAWEALPNPGVNQSGGAGVAAAQFVVDQGAAVVASGDFGPNAAAAFRSANIEMRLFIPEVSTVQQAIESFKQGKLLPF